MAFELGDPQSLFDYIESQWQNIKFKDHTQTFLPKSVFDQITNMETITAMVAQDDELQLSPEDTLAFADRVHHEAPKLFANCVCSGLSLKFLRDLLDCGLTDESIPLKNENCPGRAYTIAFQAFRRSQKQFNVPFFGLNSVQQLDDNFAMPISLDEDSKSLRGKGAFGEVYEVTIHGDYYFFPYVSGPRLYHLQLTEQS
jgi:hypothetical protein